MFKAITISTGEVDAGSVAEALIYYGRVNVFVRGGTVAGLVKKLGYEVVRDAMDIGILDLTFERELYAVHSHKNDRPVTHDFANVSLAKTARGQPINDAADEIEHQFVKTFGSSAETKARARALALKMKVQKGESKVLEQTRRDIKDNEYLYLAATAWLKAVVPEYEPPTKIKIEAATIKGQFVILNNLDFRAINQVYHRRVPASHSSISVEWLLSHLLDARKELVLSAEGDTDLQVSDAVSAILQQRVATIAKRLNKSRDDLAYFHTVEFQGRNFREAINEGSRTGEELLNLLQDQETLKFKAWLAEADPDGFLLKEYDKAVFSRHSWTDNLSFKAAKIAIFTGMGAMVDIAAGTMGLATLASAGVSAAVDATISVGDEVVGAKLLKGWKPNQFIEGPATKFLEVVKTSAGK